MIRSFLKGGIFYKTPQLHENASISKDSDIVNKWYVDTKVNNTQTWKLVKIEEPIIDVITIRQARELLIELDLFDAIEDAINQIQDPKEKRKLLNYWEYSDSFNLNHSQLLDIAATIDLTQDQLITLFRNASKL